MKEKTSGSLNFQIIEGAFFAVIGVFIIVVSSGMNPYGSWSLAPGLFPLIMGVILLVLAISLIFQAVRRLIGSELQFQWHLRSYMSGFFR